MSIDDRPRQPASYRFATTRWSLVQTVGGRDTANSRNALAELCSLYWYPLYAYARRRGHDADEARDLTQSFFAMLLEKQSVGRADPGRGRFRTFLLSSMQNFLAGEWRKKQTLKRGGDREILSLNFESAEQSYVSEPSHDLSPETEFERRWALGLLERAVANVREYYAERGKLEIFEALKGALDGGGETLPYAQLAERLGHNEGALRTAVSRLRARWSHQIRDLVADTVDDKSKIDDELQSLIESLGK